MPRNCIRETSPKENEIFLWKMDPPNKERRSPENGPSSARPCCSSLKMFLVALSFAYFAKALSGSYMKSTITQLERRFDIPSYLIGVIDGSFEIGNLLVIAFVSYFGAKLHRPKIIAIGCLLMSLGTFLIALPHFIIGRYKFETSIRSSVNSSSNLSPCPVSSGVPATAPSTTAGPSSGCEHESRLSMWIYVFLGNILRGIGETPVQPLGISYIDDHALEENAAFYIGCVQTISVIGPVFGYLLGSVCAKIYVDIGFVNMESISITPGDARWVGAWWLGYLIAGLITLLSAVPFWFLPKSLPLPERQLAKYSPERTSFIKDSPLLEHKYQADEPANFLEMAKDFLPTLRSLLGNPVYSLYLCITIIQFNSLIGMVTYKPKYIEQHYGQSASKANFLMGVINIPAVALGMFSGGVIMKKSKLSIMGAAKFALGTSLLGYFLSLFFFAMGCENASVAGITRSYNGTESLYKEDKYLLASCNTICDCPRRNWDPVCGENGLTYISPCLAGCRTSHGSGMDTVFEQCSCVAVGNHTASAGQCSNRDSCHRVFPYFLALSVITSFIISLGGTPGYMLLIRCIRPQLKSLALGFHTLTTRTLAGIPAPIYFGAIIDTTCLKWGQKKCGGRGACRIYNTTAYRIAYLGLTLGLRTASFFLCFLGLVVLRRHVRQQERNTLANGGTGAAAGELQALRKEENNSCNSDQCTQTADYDPERETRL
ncbi:solute carrier organic anion transporter family member 1C1-like isoform X1 [Sinocyclocheilus rhinocerous]|uniref:solute carrier organic anion transporter family member 1C1-like isoform X1 n=2 Tax=Sinocyclocheilus rhinocerous TaxID=307959 RepID=UPI0007B82D8F|nr:PREDICTED: solute carrier organic anion transporter family member 1C1-like isoform X1 [Sinocyclocheilus rhinocerous]XP_016367650.1 PREDICTED: solute carrier organic anion transporter family member 1C1-like isoform X1 [Sinocyclocheilus rhinocerous]XP_016367651.1 PREDICTED: solute carrier organic anion transporter family member 1C1-like isoform X1 [Sinocyclocheilus rhinocerous]